MTIYFDAALIEAVRRHAERIGRAVIGDAWLCEHRGDVAPRFSNDDLGAGVPEIALWYEDQTAEEGWFADATAKLSTLAAFPLVGRRPGWTLDTYVFRDRWGGVGHTFARRIGAPLLSPETLHALVAAGHSPGRHGEPGAETILRWDARDPAVALWASIAYRARGARAR